MIDSMRGILHYQYFDVGHITVWGNFCLTAGKHGFCQYVLSHKEWGGLIIQHVKFITAPFNISKYFLEYNGQAYVSERIADRFMFIGDGPLKLNGKEI